MKLCISKAEATFLQECIEFKKYALRHNWNDEGVESKAVGESLIYRIDKDIEKKLDKYEDYPKLYIKKYFFFNKKKIMFYFMRKKTPIKKPSGYYVKIMKNGYRQNNFKFLQNL